MPGGEGHVSGAENHVPDAASPVDRGPASPPTTWNHRAEAAFAAAWLRPGHPPLPEVDHSAHYIDSHDPAADSPSPQPSPDIGAEFVREVHPIPGSGQAYVYGPPRPTAPPGHSTGDNRSVAGGHRHQAGISHATQGGKPRRGGRRAGPR
ncbi:hypothetical protein ABZ896_37760 [Streptomyces sp. NPDC047072]|uniref:hypothetical protein n=1 Tax=Streptomyces sp. NPDC047072 TaxID=3154809 RepID=UPI0033D8FFEE